MREVDIQIYFMHWHSERPNIVPRSLKKRILYNNACDTLLSVFWASRGMSHVAPLKGKIQA
jgi:hypothetical protein